MAKILLVEDDRVLAETIQRWLSRENNTVEVVGNGREGMDRLRFYDYDLVILDWNLPEMSGIEICRQYRLQGGNRPLIMLTGKKEVNEKTTGLDSGADDYLTKPFEMEELSARLRALMRRQPATKSNVLAAGDMTLDTVTLLVTVAGQAVALVPKELALLEFFMRHPNETFSQEALLNRVWAAESDVSPDTVRTYITRIRQKVIGKSRTCEIVTAHRLGYRLQVKSEAGG